MAKTWRIDVHFDGKSFQIQPHESIRLEQGDAVEWYFLGLPNTYGPFLAFDDPDADSPLGPFTSVIYSRTRVVAQGSSGKTSTNPFVYQVSAYGAEGGRLEESASGQLENLDSERRTPTEIDVTVAMDAKGPFLQLSTAEVALREGATVTWNFKGIDEICEEPWIPEILFASASVGSRRTNHYFGPFVHYTLLDVLEPAEPRPRRVMKVVGSGNNGVAGLYRYTAAVVAVSNGERLFLSSEDPIIANDGELTILP